MMDWNKKIRVRTKTKTKRYYTSEMLLFKANILKSSMEDVDKCVHYLEFFLLLFMKNNLLSDRLMTDSEGLQNKILASADNCSSRQNQEREPSTTIACQCFQSRSMYNKSKTFQIFKLSIFTNNHVIHIDFMLCIGNMDLYKVIKCASIQKYRTKTININ